MKITMPQLGESVSEGTVGRWLKQEGDYVERDESLVEILTDKVNTELPSPIAGKLVKILIPEDTKVDIGTVMAIIEEVPTASSSVSSSAGDQELVVSSISPAKSTPPEQVAHPTLESHTGPATEASSSVYNERGANGQAQYQAEQIGSSERPHISPLAKRMAQEYAIDLDKIRGSGIGGRVRKEDILAYIAARESKEAQPPSPPLLTTSSVSTQPKPPLSSLAPDSLKTGQEEEDHLLTISPMRRAIAEHMVRSKHTSPHATMMMEVDMTEIVFWRERNREMIKEREGLDLTYIPFVIKATVEALKEYPIMNSVWTDEKIILKQHINIGVAVATDDGLVVPVIRDADGKSILGLAREVKNLSTKARNNRLTLADLQGGTFTVNNPGVFGTTISVPIINQPQAGIVTMDAVVKRPVVVNDAIAVRSIMFLCLSFDHRTVDGAASGRFLQFIRRKLEGPVTSIY